MSYLEMAKAVEAKLQSAPICPLESVDYRFKLLSEALSSLEPDFQRAVRKQGHGVIPWIKENCPDLAALIGDLETSIDLACLSQVISLDEYKKLLQQWVEAYCEGFRRFGQHE